MVRSVAEFETTAEGGLTAAERKLIADVRAGRGCWLCDPENPALPSAATDNTRIRAPLLRLLILGGTPDCGLHEFGVSLFGGWIEGHLDLAYCKARGQTQLDWCHFAETPIFYNARLRQLNLTHSHLPGLLAQGTKVDASLFLSGITATGTVDVIGAKIGGQLDCVGAWLDGGKDGGGTAGMALNAQGVEVGDGLFLSGLTATGTVAVNGAKIGGQLDCERARLDGGKDGDGTAGTALNAQVVEVGDSLFLSGITATGTVAVNGAKIGGQLSCIGARLDGGKDGDGTVRDALNAQRMTVAQGFFFRKLTSVAGRIVLTSAHVGDLVDDAASWPTGTDELFLDGFTYEKLSASAPTTFAARRAWLHAGSHWQGDFHPQPYTQFARVLRQAGHAGEARKVLMAAALAEAKAHEKRHRARRRFARNLRRLSARADDRALAEVIESVRRLPASLREEEAETRRLFRLFHTPLSQPAGATAPPDGATLALAQRDFRNRMRWRATTSRLAILRSRVTHAFLSRIVGHGHAPHRAITAILLTVALSAAWYSIAWDRGAMVPNSDVILTSEDWRQAVAQDGLTPTSAWEGSPPARHYETFYALAYAFDATVPLIDLGQQSAWTATTVTTFGQITRWLTMLLGMWGWVVTALGAAAITGLIQRNQPD